MDVNMLLTTATTSSYFQGTSSTLACLLIVFPVNPHFWHPWLVRGLISMRACTMVTTTTTTIKTTTTTFKKYILYVHMLVVLESWSHLFWNFDVGISYLSRAQESIAKGRNSIPTLYEKAAPESSSIFSAVDKAFIDRIKSKVHHWKNVRNEPTKTSEGY